MRRTSFLFLFLFPKGLLFHWSDFPDLLTGTSGHGQLTVQIFSSPASRVCLQLYEKIYRLLTDVPTDSRMCLQLYRIFSQVCLAQLRRNFYNRNGRPDERRAGESRGGRRCFGGTVCPSGSRDPRRRDYPGTVAARDGNIHGADDNQLWPRRLEWPHLRVPAAVVYVLPYDGGTCP